MAMTPKNSAQTLSLVLQHCGCVNATITIKYVFSLHLHLQGPLRAVEIRGLRPWFSTAPSGPGKCLFVNIHI